MGFPLFDRLNTAAGLSFLLGGSLFAAGAAMAQRGVESLVTVNVTYLVGGFFFSLGGYLSIRLAAPGQRAWRSAVVLFVGTLLFAVSLVAAFAVGITPRQSNGWIWLPDILGCVCFLASGHLVGGGRVRLLPHALDWWVAAINQLGSVLFFFAGVAAFTRPATSVELAAALVNSGTFGGALCFALAGAIQVFSPPTTKAPLQVQS